MSPSQKFRRDLLWWSAGVVLTAAALAWLIGSMVDDLHPEDTVLYVILTIACVSVPSSGALTAAYLLRRFAPQRFGPWPFWLLYAALLPAIVLSLVVVAGVINGSDFARHAAVTAMVLIYNLPPLLVVGVRYFMADAKEPALVPAVDKPS